MTKLMRHANTWLAAWYRVGLGFLVGSGLATSAFAQAPAAAPPADADALRQLVRGLQTFYRASRPEKAYLHLDKTAYAAGETIWFKTYLADAAQHRPDSLSGVLYVELATNKRVIARRTLSLSRGMGHGSLALADTLAPGTYLLRAYTGWMRNADPAFFYQCRVQVWPGPLPATPTVPRRTRHATPLPQTTAATLPDVQFFPEGGSLVEGLESVVAFKAVGPDGLGLAVSGQVLDAQNQPVASFSSHHKGMGTFLLTPAPGQRYHAVLASPSGPHTVPLPAALPSGYRLRVATGANAFFVSIQQRGAGGPLLLLGQVRGTPAYLGRTQVVGAAPVVVRIPKSQFPAGIVHFTLFTAQGVPLAERLAYNDRPAGLRVTLKPDRDSYGPRQPVRLHVAVADSAGRPVATDLSLAVAAAGSRSPLAETIASNLLLTSDLAGYVEEPGYYFQLPGPETTQALDELLLTQGWRRFTWQSLLANNQPPTPIYGVERSLGLLGQVTTTSGQPAPRTRLTLLQTAPTTQSLTGTTDAEGRFLFNGLGDCDTSRFTIQARPARGNNGRNLVVRLTPEPLLPASPLPALPPEPAPAEAAAIRSSQQQVLASRQFRLDTTNTILLNNVAVTGRRQSTTAPIARLYNAANATVVQVDKIVGASASTSIFQLLQGRVAGVQIIGAEPNVRVTIRGVSSISGSSMPLFLLDGVPTDINAISNTPVSDIETVEILKGAEAAMFGSRGGGGVMAFYTHRSNPTYRAPLAGPTPGTLQVVLPGYDCGREFYQPRYDQSARAARKPDPRRATLYWNPTVRTDANGQAELVFYTADEAGQFDLHAEGLGSGGQPLLGDSRLEVK